MYDTHCHLNFAAFKENYHDVINRSLEKGMLLNIVGTQYETSRRAIEIAHEFENAPVYAAVGLHPTHLGKGEEMHEWDAVRYQKLATDPKVVAIGETGIDHYRDGPPLEAQVKIFKEHLTLASKLQKPVIIHTRPSHGTFDAYYEIIEVLKEGKISSFLPTGVVHCFLGNLEIAEQFLDLGFFISFTGIITYKNADPKVLDAVRSIPLDKILIETDSPYLTPEPYRGKSPNVPLYVEFVAQKIAEIKNLPKEEVIKETMKNARGLFGL